MLILTTHVYKSIYIFKRHLLRRVAWLYTLANMPKAYLVGHSLMLLSASLFNLWLYTVLVSTGGASGRETAYQCRRHKRTLVQSLNGEDPLEEKMATNSSILALERGVWRATVHSFTQQSQTRLKLLSMH